MADIIRAPNWRGDQTYRQYITFGGCYHPHAESGGDQDNGRAAEAEAQRRNVQDQLKSGETQVLVFPEAFPNQGGLPIKVDGQTIGGIAASGAASEVDEAIAQAAIDALLEK